jgi:hypothetical protein
VKPKSLIASVALAASACSTTPPPVHAQMQLDTAATSCGLAPGELVQDGSERRLLIVVRQDASEAQRVCVSRWARRSGLRPVFVDMPLAKADLNEGCAMLALLAASVNFMLVKVEPTYLPAINMNGVVQRVIAVTIEGPPALISPVQKRVEAEGWKASIADDKCLRVDTAGHSLDEVTALSFRVNNGEFGDLKLNFMLRPDGKPKS